MHELAHAYLEAVETAEQKKQINDLLLELREQYGIMNTETNVAQSRIAGTILSGRGFIDADEMATESMTEMIVGKPREVAKRVVRIISR